MMQTKFGFRSLNNSTIYFCHILNHTQNIIHFMYKYIYIYILYIFFSICIPCFHLIRKISKDRLLKTTSKRLSRKFFPFATLFVRMYCIFFFSSLRHAAFELRTCFACSITRAYNSGGAGGGGGENILYFTQV